MPNVWDQLGQTGHTLGEFISHYPIKDKKIPAALFEQQLKTAKFERCVTVGLFTDIRDCQLAGEVLTDFLQKTRTDDVVKANEVF